MSAPKSPEPSYQKVHYLLPRRRCGCGKTTIATPPCGAAGTVVYGPNVNATAILLASESNVPIERTAALMAMMLSTPVSPGFVARALERFAQRLAAAGFDEAMTTALRAEDVLLIRHAKGVLELHPTQQIWASEVITVLREANKAVVAATADGRDHLDPRLRTDLRAHYDTAVAWGITTNRHRNWDKGKQLLRAGPQKPQTTSGHLRLLARTRPLLPRPLLPGQRSQPRHPPYRRHPQRPHRQPLAPHTLNDVAPQPNP